jgi:hypothetical protein
VTDSWHGPDQEGGNLYSPGQPIPQPKMIAEHNEQQLEKLTVLDAPCPGRRPTHRDRRLAVGLSLLESRLSENRRMPPPSQLEVVVFWIVGIVVTILSSGVATYASHHHFWG